MSNICISCGLDFKSTSSFDQHRTGEPSKRRCLTVKELKALGFEPDEKGKWRVPMPQEYLSKLHSAKSSQVNAKEVDNDQPDKTHPLF